MRTLNEYRAEIFRRGEERIKQRRRARNRTLGLCIPLALCITVCSVAILPSMLPKGKDIESLESADRTEDGSSMGSLVCSYTEVEIKGTGDGTEHYEKVTDKVAVTKIFSAIHSLYDFDMSADRAEGQLEDGNVSTDNNAQAGASGKIKGYVITFATEDGARSVYRLNGTVLLNTSTNESLVLTEAQAAELMADLGINQ